MERLGHLYLNGDNVPADPHKARHYLDLAAKRRLRE
jgi:TPR repeat protein